MSTERARAWTPGSADLEEILLHLPGSLDVERRGAGIAPRRLPAWTRPLIPDLFMDAMVGCAAGVRLALRTDSPWIEVDVHPTTIRWQGDEPLDPAFDLVQAGVVRGLARAPHPTQIIVGPGGPSDVQFVGGSPSTLRFDGLDPAHDVEIWFHNASSVEVTEVRVAADASLTAPAADRPHWLHHGSSISHCMDVDRPTDGWTFVAASAGGVDLRNLGLAGQCQLDPFVAATIRDLPADMISLKLGINLINAGSMTTRTFGPAVEGFLDTIRHGHPVTPLLIVSPIWCPAVAGHPGPTTSDEHGMCTVLSLPQQVVDNGLTIERIHARLAAIVARRRLAGDHHLHFLDGYQLFGPDDEPELYDLLHPTTRGYATIGERFAAEVFGPGGVFADVTRHD